MNFSWENYSQVLSNRWYFKILNKYSNKLMMKLKNNIYNIINFRYN